MNNTNVRKSDRTYFDDVYFPRGFNRSGEFTVTESMILNDYGHTMSGLSKGDLTPLNAEEEHFIQAVRGEVEAITQLEKAWLKYQSLTKPKVTYTINGRYKPTVEYDSSEYSLEL